MPKHSSDKANAIQSKRKVSGNAAYVSVSLIKMQIEKRSAFPFGFASFHPSPFIAITYSSCVIYFMFHHREKSSNHFIPVIVIVLSIVSSSHYA